MQEISLEKSALKEYDYAWIHLRTSSTNKSFRSLDTLDAAAELSYVPVVTKIDLFLSFARRNGILWITGFYQPNISFRVSYGFILRQIQPAKDISMLMISCHRHPGLLKSQTSLVSVLRIRRTFIFCQICFLWVQQWCDNFVQVDLCDVDKAEKG